MSQLYPKNSQTMDQVLKVQEVSISGSDSGLFSIAGGNTFVSIGEPVQKIYVASCKVDSTNLVTQFAQASLVIVDSTAHTAGGNQQAIQVTGLAALAAGDCLVIKYSVLEHL